MTNTETYSEEYLQAVMAFDSPTEDYSGESLAALLDYIDDCKEAECES